MIHKDFLDSSLWVNSLVDETPIQLRYLALSRINFKWPCKDFVANLLNDLFV